MKFMNPEQEVHDHPFHIVHEQQPSIAVSYNFSTNAFFLLFPLIFMLFPAHEVYNLTHFIHMSTVPILQNNK